MPSFVYEALPFIYLLIGAGALFGVDAGFGQMSGGLLMAIGVVVLRMRIQYRKRESIRGMMTSRNW